MGPPDVRTAVILSKSLVSFSSGIILTVFIESFPYFSVADSVRDIHGPAGELAWQYPFQTRRSKLPVSVLLQCVSARLQLSPSNVSTQVLSTSRYNENLKQGEIATTGAPPKRHTVTNLTVAAIPDAY